MRLLFITRKYPPMVGGMEKMSEALAKEFAKSVDTTLIKWGGSQKFLPLIYPLFFIKAIFLIRQKKINHIHIGDGLLSPLGLLLKTIFKIPTTSSVVGLDVTFRFPGYQMVISHCLRGLDKVICISTATEKECLKRGIPQDKLVVIPLGVYAEDFVKKASRDDLNKIVRKNLDRKKVIITVGRLVKRKGVRWFIENVFPHLESNIIYLVIGDGPEKEAIMALIKRRNFSKRIFLLGKIDNENLKIIYNTADMFVMPNIRVKGTIEGFGLVAVEASSTGLPVIASDIEGISSAVINGKTGKLVKSRDVQKFKYAIDNSYSFKRKEVSKITKEKYSWNEVKNEYLKEIRRI